MDTEELQEPEDITNDMPTDISWEELEHMTDGFSDERKIGSGYGVVYKGVQENGKTIAVKKFYHRPGLDEKQFQNEVQILTRLEHQNIVRLIGQSYKEQERCVEYNGNLVLAKMIDRVICLEYLHNGSLEKHLSDESCGFPWHKRYQIIKGICEGLNYLHEHSVFHLDLKPGNILLDHNMVPKIADFGLSRLFSGTSKSHTTTNFIGTRGFMPPEYIDKLKISDKYDVFSLGVIIILIMTGPNGYSRLCDMASRDFIELVHGNWKTRLPKPELGDSSYSYAHSIQVKTCITIALHCLESDRHKRPSIGDIVYRLNKDFIQSTGPASWQRKLFSFFKKKEQGPRQRGGALHGRKAPAVVDAAEARVQQEQGARQRGVEHFTLDMLHAATDGFSLRRLFGTGIFGSSRSKGPGSVVDDMIHATTDGFSRRRLFGTGIFGSSRSKGPGSVVEHFTLDMIHAATDGFSDDRRIGTGSFGSVYRGTLPDGREVAIKRAEYDRETAFNSELLTALARANHENIVCLLGCCDDSGERVLVYEFMANGTLHDQLHSRSPMAAVVSSWLGRLYIAVGAARGLEYLHVDAVPPIIHRDVKSANILLDNAWTAKIADFGLYSVGTVEYMDQEYHRLQHLTDKSDVYSFGVVLLELMSGCRVVQRYAKSVRPKNVVEFAVPHILAHDVTRVLDPRLPAPTPDEAEVLAYVGYLAADCVCPVGSDRPSMTQVAYALEHALAAVIPVWD